MSFYTDNVVMAMRQGHFNAAIYSSLVTNVSLGNFSFHLDTMGKFRQPT